MTAGDLNDEITAVGHALLQVLEFKQRFGFTFESIIAHCHIIARSRLSKRLQDMPRSPRFYVSSHPLSCTTCHRSLKLPPIQQTHSKKQEHPMPAIQRFPFFLVGTTLNCALLSSFGALTFPGPFFATSDHPPPAAPALLGSTAPPIPIIGCAPAADSTTPLSASFLRRTNSSAKRRPSRVCELA